MRIKDYVAIDLETTGISVSKDKIIEVGLIKVINSHIEEMFSCIINPNMPVSTKILNLTGIDENEIKTARYIQDVIGDIVEFCDGFDLIGHNTIFDYSFIKKEANNAGLNFEKRGIDTYKLCKKILPPYIQKNLTDACAYFGIERKNMHRAFSDAYFTHMLYQEILANFKELEIISEIMKVKLKKMFQLEKEQKRTCRNY